MKTQKQYEAIRLYFPYKKTVRDVATIFGNSYRGFAAIIWIILKKNEQLRSKCAEYQNTSRIELIRRKWREINAQSD